MGSVKEIGTLSIDDEWDDDDDLPEVVEAS